MIDANAGYRLASGSGLCKRATKDETSCYAAAGAGSDYAIVPSDCVMPRLPRHVLRWICASCHKKSVEG
ncbi:hypothetical protein [Shimia isoporae]|uniref:hypothetical protein n=1 Tax=Shimia isoporae TaxID=647720 RepID=UPI0010450C4F|nr:hypothetical protein [Shimia isoporae]